MSFKDANPGCVDGSCGSCSSGCSGVFANFTVDGSCGPIAGATITISGVGTCTTNSAGNCSIAIASTGSYSYMVSSPGYTTVTGTFSVATCASVSVNVTMALGSGFNCCLDLAIPTTAASYSSAAFGLLDSIEGPTTFTFGSSWVTQKNLVACLACAINSPNHQINISTDCTTGIVLFTDYDTVSNCPIRNPIFPVSATGDYILTAWTYGPPLILQFTWNSSGSGDYWNNVACGTSDVITVTF